MTEFVHINEAAELLGMSARKARTWLQEHGLPGVNTSKGKRATWQWSRRAILALVDTLQSESAMPQKIAPRKKDSPRIVGRSPREIYAAIMMQ